MLTLSAKPQMWYFHVVVLQRMTRNYAKERAARAARLFFTIRPIKFFTCEVVIADCRYQLPWVLKTVEMPSASGYA